jgi:hypothetical protein
MKGIHTKSDRISTVVNAIGLPLLIVGMAVSCETRREAVSWWW